MLITKEDTNKAYLSQITIRTSEAKLKDISSILEDFHTAAQRSRDMFGDDVKVIINTADHYKAIVTQNRVGYKGYTVLEVTKLGTTTICTEFWTNIKTQSSRTITYTIREIANPPDDYKYDVIHRLEENSKF